mgnify:CR=1 FL=1
MALNSYKEERKNMSYTALYRKFRPDAFSDVKGQDHIVTTLKNQLRANRIGHAYLFTGTRGTGKTTVAKIFAKTVNCEHPTEDGPCGECRICKAIAAGASMNVIEIDAASNNGVDNIREIIDEVSYSPAEGKYKVYIIDEVHMLSPGAFNALLKTLEEPPSYVIFILATTEVHKIPITILSRCQRYDFKRISIDTITDRMKELMDTEQVQVEDRALRYIAKVADGSMRDALSLLDQCIAFHLGKELTYDMTLDVLGAVDTEVFSRLLRFVMDRNVLGCIELLEEIVMQGRELVQFVTDFTWYLRNLMLVQTADNLEDVIDMSTDNLANLKEEASMLSMDQIIRYIHIFSELSGQIRYAAQKRVLVEVALVKLCKPQMEQNLESVLERLRILEEKMERGIPMMVTNAPGAGNGSAGGSGAAGDGYAAAETPQSAPAPVKAAPADLQRISASWKAIVGQTSGMFRQFLQGAVPKYNSETGDAKLFVEFADQLASIYVERPEAADEIRTIIEQMTGKTVEVQLILADQHANAALSTISVDDALTQAIHGIPVEEDDESDFDDGEE